MGKTVVQQINNSERDHCIDLLRGLCLFCIIFNHTCFNSGTSYVPQAPAEFTMLIDVPALFFVSGMTYCYVGRSILVGNILKLSLSFTLVSILFNFADRSLTWEKIFQPLFLAGFEVPQSFKYLQVSYWFVSVYAIVLIWATVIIQKLKALYPLIAILCLGVYFLHFFMHINLSDLRVLGVNGQMIWFYLAVFLLGYLFREKIWISKYKNLWALVCVIGAVGVYAITYTIDGDFVFKMLLNKFPVRLPYVAISFVSIGLFMWFYKPERKNKILEHIGQNALFYYIAQGVGASLLNYVVDYVSAPILIKLALMFLLNLLITALGAEVFKFMYEEIGLGYRWCTKRWS